MSANDRNQELLISLNGQNSRPRVSAGKLSKPILPEKFSRLLKHLRLLLAVTGEQVRPEDRVCADRPVVRAARKRVLLKHLRRGAALLKAKESLEAMLPLVGEMLEINRAGKVQALYFLITRNK